MATQRNGEGELILGGVRLEALAGHYGTPLYVYDVGGIAEEARALAAAFGDAPHLVAYAVKANTAGTIIKRLAAQGCGADVVSGAELEVALACGVHPDRVLFNGVAKTDDEITLALRAGDKGICSIHMESLEEIERVAAVARTVGRRARVGLRVNPELESVGTHDHIATGHDEAKFGIAASDVPRAVERVRSFPELDLGGLATHVGSQLVDTNDYRAGAKRVFDLARGLFEKSALRFVDTGGGFGIDYGAGCPVAPADFVHVARDEQKAAGLEGVPIFVEPGRRLVASFGVLVATVIQRKIAKPLPWTFVDAGMNDLIRPALYQARHRVVALRASGANKIEQRFAGPVCESSDDFGAFEVEADTKRVAFLDAGAYGFTMASQYNGRALPAEVFVDAGRIVHATERGDVRAWIDQRLR